MNQNRKLLMPVLFAALLIAGMFIGAKLTPVNRMFSGSMSASIYNYSKIQDILYLIERDYVDKVDQEQLVNMAISGMLRQLDPHSVYITAEELKAVTEELTGNFEGIGVQFSIRRDTVVVVKVITGGPSEKAGLLAGDRIVAIDGEGVAGAGISDVEVMKRLKGPKGSVVEVEVFRTGRREVLPFRLERDVIRTSSIDAAYMINQQTGYIKMHTFAETTYSEFMEALTQLTSAGMKNLVFDLRGNGGGLLDQAILIANEFLGKRDLIVYTMGKSGRKKSSYANGQGSFIKGGLVILIDDFSASASEIIAGALQDNDRGWIVGRRSFGKGLVQQQVMLADGSALRITTERYYTPVGRSIQKPYAADDQDAYYGELLERYNHGGMQSADSVRFSDSLKFETIRKKRIVYGGGGIMPDYFVPLQPAHETELFRNLSNTGVIFEFAAGFADRSRASLLQKFDEKAFMTGFKLEASEMRSFWTFAAQRGIKPGKEKDTETEKQIGRLIRAFIARDLYGDELFYRIMNQQDEAVKKALSVVGK